MTEVCKFSGDVKTRWLNCCREMELLEDLEYIDSDGQKWKAYKGDYIDGASIPRFFWRVVGSPFTGRYRRASVIHDVYCKTQVIDSVKVHRVFHEMMLVDGLGTIHAWVMWLAVRLGGPRFKGVQDDPRRRNNSGDALSGESGSRR